MKTPYIKKIVELHKIHKAIENKNGGNGGGSSNKIPFPFEDEDLVPIGFAKMGDWQRDLNGDGNYYDVNDDSVKIYNLNEMSYKVIEDNDDLTDHSGVLFMYLYPSLAQDPDKFYISHLYGYSRQDEDEQWSGPSYHRGNITCSIKINGTTYYAAPIGG